MKGKWGILALAVLLVAWGIFALAAEYGTQSDPLVSLSYITDVFRPALLKDAESASQKRANDANTAAASAEARMDAKLNEFLDRNTASVNASMLDAVAAKVTAQIPTRTSNAPFATVSLSSGKTLALSSGCEVLVRSGSGVTNANESPAFIDMTTGGALSSGTALSPNHLYVCPGNGRSIRANGAVVVLVRGKYSLS